MKKGLRHGISRAAVSLAAATTVVSLVPGAAGAYAPASVSRVSVGSAGAQADSFSGGSAVSATGRYVVFVSFATNLVAGDTNGTSDVFVRDRLAGVTRRVSHRTVRSADRSPTSRTWRISADGRHVAFASTAPDLVPGGTDGHFHVFVRDWVAGVTGRRTSARAAGSPTVPASTRRCPRTGGTSPSCPRRRTWSPATPTPPATSSCATRCRE